MLGKNTLKFVTLCAVLMVSSTFGAQSVQARLVVPQTIPFAPESSQMRMGSRQFPPFGHVVFCRENPAHCQARGASRDIALTQERWRQLTRVNQRVNRSITARHDPRTARGADQWSLAPRYGDCEDYALTKRAQLLRMGWPSSSLLIATASVPRVGQHAVLIVRTQAGDYVLDNLKSEIKAWEDTNYDWRSMQSPQNPRNWYSV